MQRINAFILQAGCRRIISGVFGIVSGAEKRGEEAAKTTFQKQKGDNRKNKRKIAKINRRTVLAEKSPIFSVRTRTHTFFDPGTEWGRVGDTVCFKFQGVFHVSGLGR